MGKEIFAATKSGLKSCKETPTGLSTLYGLGSSVKVSQTGTYGLHIDGNNFCVGARSGIHISNDSGRNWKLYDVNTPGFAYSPGDRYNNDRDPRLHYSTVWSTHCDQNNFYAGTFQGISISEDNGATWNTYLSPYRIEKVYAKDGNVWAVTQDKLFFSQDNGKNWQEYPWTMGDYSLIFFHAPDPDGLKEYEKQLAEDSKLPKEELIKRMISEMDQDDYYRIIGIHPSYGSNCKLINKAYKKRAILCHSDKNLNNKQMAEQATVLLVNANDSLKKDCLN